MYKRFGLVILQKKIQDKVFRLQSQHVDGALPQHGEIETSIRLFCDGAKNTSSLRSDSPPLSPGRLVKLHLKKKEKKKLK